MPAPRSANSAIAPRKRLAASASVAPRASASTTTTSASCTPDMPPSSSTTALIPAAANAPATSHAPVRSSAMTPNGDPDPETRSRAKRSAGLSGQGTGPLGLAAWHGPDVEMRPLPPELGAELGRVNVPRARAGPHRQRGGRARGLADHHAGDHRARGGHRLVRGGDAASGQQQAVHVDGHEAAVGDVVGAVLAPDLREERLAAAGVVDVYRVADLRDAVGELASRHAVLCRELVLAEHAARLAHAHERRGGGYEGILEPGHVLAQEAPQGEDLAL